MSERADSPKRGCGWKQRQCALIWMLSETVRWSVECCIRRQAAGSSNNGNSHQLSTQHSALSSSMHSTLSTRYGNSLTDKPSSAIPAACHTLSSAAVVVAVIDAAGLLCRSMSHYLRGLLLFLLLLLLLLVGSLLQ